MFPNKSRMGTDIIQVSNVSVNKALGITKRTAKCNFSQYKMREKEYIRRAKRGIVIQKKLRLTLAEDHFLECNNYYAKSFSRTVNGASKNAT